MEFRIVFIKNIRIVNTCSLYNCLYQLPLIIALIPVNNVFLGFQFTVKMKTFMKLPVTYFVLVYKSTF